VVADKAGPAVRVAAKASLQQLSTFALCKLDAPALQLSHSSRRILAQSFYSMPISKKLPFLQGVCRMNLPAVTCAHGCVYSAGCSSCVRFAAPAFAQDNDFSARIVRLDCRPQSCCAAAYHQNVALVMLHLFKHLTYFLLPA
jgi:hypothetical protein